MNNNKIDEEKAIISSTIILDKHWEALIVFFTLVGLFMAINYNFSIRFFTRMGLGWLEYDTAYLYALFACFLSLVFIKFPAQNKTQKGLTIWDLLLFFLTIITSLYLMTNAWTIAMKGLYLQPSLELKISALILCLLVIEALRRTLGSVLFFVAIFFACYPMFASYLPGPLEGLQLSFWRTVSFHALSSSSILGTITTVYGNLIVGFSIFGVAMGASGGADAFLKFAIALVGNRKGGPAKVATISSACFGSISGVVTSNIITTGSFTIPAMKKAGYRADFAGAVEAVASTGGNIMPPVMGSTAFLIASFLGISYFNVCMAAAIPAILYYYALYVQVSLYAETHSLKGFDDYEIPSIREAIYDLLPFLIAIVSLVYFLYMGLEGRAPFVSSIVLILISSIKQIRNKQKVNFVRNFIKLINDISKPLIRLLGMLAGLGFVIGTFSVTGIGNSFAHEVNALAGDNLAHIMIACALGSIFLGMGMPVIPCYIFLSTIIAPALVKVGVIPIAAHLYIFYWALSSYLTPPVALGAYVAASISQADFFRTAVSSMKLGFLIYLLPICFVLNPSLLLQGSLKELVPVLFSLIIGIYIISAAFAGFIPKIGYVKQYHFRITMA
ncbi:MAG: TRAP transporter fused permease subunit, partial [Atribacterota bacterium]|nr:TRAP transporter fused permease subunit [Atribacterota bacterium]